MPFKNTENKDEKQRELEIESILEETRYLADQEKMEKTAQKYRAKPQMTEIFSNASKKPRLFNKNPLDEDEEDVSQNTIEGDKTAATMQAALMMDGSDESVLTPQQAEAEAKRKAEEKKKREEAKRKALEVQKAAEEEDNKIVTLSPEYSEETLFAGEVIDEVDQFDDHEPEIESINTIDIDLSEADGEEKHAEEEKQEQSRYEELFGVKNTSDGKPPRKVVAKVPIYRTDDQKDTVNVKAGRFSEVVASEYEQYIHSKNPSVITHVLIPDPEEEQDGDEEKAQDTRSAGEKVLSGLVGFFSKDESDDNDKPQDKVKNVDDYTGDDDEKSILQELNSNIRKLFVRSLLTGIIAAISVILTVVTRLFPTQICESVAFAPVVYAVINFMLVGFSIFVNRVAILSGLTPLVRFKGNSDTAVAVAAVAAVIQSITSFFCLTEAKGFDINYYTVVVLIAFFANTAGKLFMVLRVKDNFRFVSSGGQKYAAKIYNNESVAKQMISGTAMDRPIIAYQHKTGFASNFLKISYAPDPSEDLASRLAPITSITAFLVAMIYGIVFASFSGAVNAFALVTAVSVPVATLLAVNIPLRNLCKKLLTFGSMLSGYPSVKQFCDSTAVMVDANELFPRDAVFLDGIKTFEEYNVDESLMCGIAILKEAQSPIAKVFDSVVAETDEKLPEVESVLYEDELGLVGWVNSERILVGNRNLMDKYNVETPAEEYEEKYLNNGRQVTYVARAGRLIAMFVTHYTADSLVMTELHRAEANGISFLVRTTDCNVTGDLICNLYKVFYRSVKVLPTGLGNVLKESQATVEDSSRAYLITGGKFSSLARAVSGSVKIKRSISLSIVIQLIAVVLGILLSATLALYAGVGVVGTLEILLYTLFWGAATLIAPKIQGS